MVTTVVSHRLTPRPANTRSTPGETHRARIRRAARRRTPRRYARRAVLPGRKARSEPPRARHSGETRPQRSSIDSAREAVFNHPTIWWAETTRTGSPRRDRPELQEATGVLAESGGESEPPIGGLLAIGVRLATGAVEQLGRDDAAAGAGDRDHRPEDRDRHYRPAALRTRRVRGRVV